MPSWGEILLELQQSAARNNGQVDFDGTRRKYLVQLQAQTGRDVIVYAADWIAGAPQGANVSIHYGDMQGLMEVFRDLRGPRLDLFLHSPGGSAEAAERILAYLRTKYDDIRVVVPLAAMSAATMLALGGNTILMGKHSQLGPIDPQLVTPSGAVPARAIIDQFEQAKEECKADPGVIGAWLPILQQYGPALLKQCENQERLARRLVSAQMRNYMFAGDPAASRKGTAIARYFGSHSRHMSHSRAIDREEARRRGVEIENLEADPGLQDAVLSVHHAYMHTLAGPAVKIIENHLGRAFIVQQQQIQLPMQMAVPMPTPSPTP